MLVTCRKCFYHFEITDNDIKFYEKVSPTFNKTKYIFPIPTLCPTCRHQKRLAFRNERVLYKRKCDLCGKSIISIYSSKSSFTVYCSKCWWSDDSNPLYYGKDMNFDENFFDVWHKLNLEVPKLALINDNNLNSINCQYTNDFAF